MELGDFVVIEHDTDIGQLENGGMNFICYLALHNCSNYMTLDFLLLRSNDVLL